MKCKICGTNTFLIDEIKDCSKCEHNGSWNDATTGWVYNDPDALKDQVEYDSECAMGDAYGAGCHMYTCTSCGEQCIFPRGDI